MKVRTVNVIILAPLHTALTVQVYGSNERNELVEVDEIESARTVPE